MREMEWPPARGGAGLLIDRHRLNARRLGGLGQTLISGDLEPAIAEIASGAPMLGLCALAPESAHALRIGRTSALLVTPTPLSVLEGWRDGWCATSVDDAGPRWRSRAPTQPKRSCRRPRPTSPRARPRPPCLSLACADCSRARLPASACMSRRLGWRRCSLGSTASDWLAPRQGFIDHTSS